MFSTIASNRLSRFAFNPKVMQFTLSKSNYSGLRACCSPPPEVSPKLTTLKIVAEAFKSIALGGAAIYTVLNASSAYGERTKIYEKEADAKEMELAAKVLGLKKVVPFTNRTPENQAADFKKANSKLLIIGIEGKRLFDPNDQHAINPVPDTLEDLMLNKQVIVNIALKNGVDKNKYPKIAEWESKFGPNGTKKAGLFEVKVAGKTLPFHGDLIEGKEIHYIPVSVQGVDMTNRLYYEVYDQKAASEKYIILREQFYNIWDNI